MVGMMIKVCMIKFNFLKKLFSFMVIRVLMEYKGK